MKYLLRRWVVPYHKRVDTGALASILDGAGSSVEGSLKLSR